MNNEHPTTDRTVFFKPVRLGVALRGAAREYMTGGTHVCNAQSEQA